MKNLVNKVMNELMTDQKLASNSLIKILTESINKSMASNESYDSIYSQLKNGLTGINEHLKDNTISNILSQFEKNEHTVDSDLHKIGKIANLEGILEGIKKTNAYTNPIIKDKTDKLSLEIKNGSEFMYYPRFIREFSVHAAHEKSIQEAVDTVKSIIDKNASDLEVLYTVNTLSKLNSTVYESVISELKTMVASKSYTSDIIKLRFGNSGLPAIDNLVNSLKLIESKNSGTFTLGLGNNDTKISNLLAPAVKLDENSMMMYADGRFLVLTESKNKSEAEINVHIEDPKFRISTLDPKYVFENHNHFYNLCEAFANLGFTQMLNTEGVETTAVRNFKIGLLVNEAKQLDVYLNNSKVENLSTINLTEALVMESPVIRNKVQMVLENVNSIFNFEFIKCVSNDRLGHDAIVYHLDESYIVCDKKNAADRNWSSMNEHSLYEFFINNFQYDISDIFKTKIDEALQLKKNIEIRKNQITENISKLEKSVNKINEAIQSQQIKPADAAKLEKIKESIESSISELKEEFIELDLNKKLDEGKKNKSKKEEETGDNIEGSKAAKKIINKVEKGKKTIKKVEKKKV